MGFREARERANLSVASVCEALRVTDAAVYCWETGAYNPTAKRLLEIAKLYNCTIDELLRGNADHEQKRNSSN